MFAGVQREAGKILVEKKPPVLQVILVGNDAASRVYVKMKKKRARKPGLRRTSTTSTKNTSENELIALVEKFNSDSGTTGLMVQLPLPKHINTHNVWRK